MQKFNYSSSVISCDYLVNVALGKYYRIETNQIEIELLLKNVPKIKLYQVLEKYCLEKKINLGITIEKFPDKKWLTNFLHILDENNEVFFTFFDHDKVIGLTRDDLKQNKILKHLETIRYIYWKKKELEVFQKDLIISGRKKNKFWLSKNQQTLNTKKEGGG